MTGPLDGIVVADFSRVLSGPWCTMTLGDLGADVIKIERPGEGDETRSWGPPFSKGVSTYFLSTNRNKRSIALDLRNPADREIAEQLISRADVVVENFRPGTLDRLGLGEARCRELRQDLVYCSITGFGPESSRPGYDAVIQAVGGLMSITGPNGGEPVKVGVAVADITAGLYATIAILAALFERTSSGEGQRVDATLLGAQVAWLANQASSTLNAGIVPGRMGSAHPSIVPYQSFHAADGPFVLAVPNAAIWRRFCEAIDRPELAEDPRFITNEQRVQNRSELIGLLEEEFARVSRASLLDVLGRAEVPAGAINDLDEVFADPAVHALRIVSQQQHPQAGEIASVAFPVQLSKTPATVRRHPPMLGEHDDEILSWLGLDPSQIEAYRTRRTR